MANQTDDYHGNIYQWNNTLSANEADTKTEYYLPNWTDLVLTGLFTILIIVTIVSNYVILYLDFLILVNQVTSKKSKKLFLQSRARVLNPIKHKASRDVAVNDF